MSILRSSKPDFPERLVRKTRFGVGLFPILLVLGLAGIMIVGAVLLYQTIENGRIRDALVQQVRDTAGAVRRIFAGAPDYEGLTSGGGLALLCEYGMVDKRYMSTGGDCKSRSFFSAVNQDARSFQAFSCSGGGVSCGGADTGNPHKMFRVRITDLDNGECSHLLGAFAGESYQRAGLVLASVRGGSSSTRQKRNLKKDGVYDQAFIAGACTGESVYVDLIFE